MNKTMIVVIVAVLVVLGGGMYLTARNPKNIDVAKQASLQGRAVFSITDAAMDMGNVTEITMQVTGVDVHSNTTGWTTISSEPKTYKLLTLNASGQSALLTDLQINADTYNQVRLMIGSISVTTKDGVNHEAKVPSNQITLNTKLLVKTGEVSGINFDFLADKSLHITGAGVYIFSPVVKTKTKSKIDVEINEEHEVKMMGGDTDDENDMGMDVDGSMRANFQIDRKQKLNIGDDDRIKFGGMMEINN